MISSMTDVARSPEILLAKDLSCFATRRRDGWLQGIGFIRTSATVGCICVSPLQLSFKVEDFLSTIWRTPRTQASSDSSRMRLMRPE